jgi:hypothetical protein
MSMFVIYLYFHVVGVQPRFFVRSVLLIFLVSLFVLLSVKSRSSHTKCISVHKTHSVHIYRYQGLWRTSLWLRIFIFCWNLIQNAELIYICVSKMSKKQNEDIQSKTNKETKKIRPWYRYICTECVLCTDIHFVWLDLLLTVLRKIYIYIQYLNKYI